MSKQLRYTTHILAILLMAGSIQSLMSLGALIVNESDETIEVVVNFIEKDSPRKTISYHNYVSPHENAQMSASATFFQKELVDDDLFYINFVNLYVPVRLDEDTALRTLITPPLYADKKGTTEINVFVNGIFLEDSMEIIKLYGDSPDPLLYANYTKDVKVIYTGNGKYVVSLVDPNEKS